VVAAASIYFMIDAVFLSIIKPLSRRLARLAIFAAVASTQCGSRPRQPGFFMPHPFLEIVHPPRN
jgi:hypothetical protein